ncbi:MULTISPECIES: DUF397 domain-containing protein [unclassified Streptomyces]|uniref:DUF397 domain-containing protein n=1 Tax=unclassified Streptomyces TaxID=2593676 RepID=UPI000C26E0B6|nr:DUF397 domain-containing protein [Streptomyces sp. CB02959]PJN37512.1 DUF397 domain-containing protein [Streptomyces sp. CB02959]
MDGHEFNSATWIKSSYSDDNGGNCVEVAPGFPGVVPVRDSKAPHGPTLVFPEAGWSSFVAVVKGGQLPF